MKELRAEGEEKGGERQRERGRKGQRKNVRLKGEERRGKDNKTKTNRNLG